MKVAFVTPRYGLEVMGGAESAARQLAEHLVAECGWQVEVFSTCALDHLTWDNVLPAGDSVLNGVTVHRFASTSGRVPEFYELDARLRMAPAEASLEQARRWLELNGPVTPDLVDAVRDSDADVIAFYPYLYYPTVMGMEAATGARVSCIPPPTTSPRCTSRSSTPPSPRPMPSATTPRPNAGSCNASIGGPAPPDRARAGGLRRGRGGPAGG